MSSDFSVQGAFAPGITVGTVSDTNDPQGLGRIRVLLSLKGPQIQSDWLQIMSFFAGPDCGAFFMPQKGDSVLLAFADADPSKPYVLGFLWNGAQKPPVPQARQQELRVIKTKLGKTIQFDDGAQGNITIIDNKNNKVVIDTATNKITLESQGDIEINAKGKITISGAQVLVQTTPGTVKADLSATGMQLNGGTSIKLNAAMIDLN
jgi:uncharacterized protein involved in type VI secretion and phage assembly